MIWTVSNKGFLPSSDPIEKLPVLVKNTELVYTWENLAYNIPHYLKEECLREEMICTLRKSDASYYHGFIDSFESQDAFERIFLLLAYFANAYVNAPEGRRKTKLPKEITIPLARVAHLTKRSPVLDYTAYILYNWKKNKNNVEPLLTFTNSKEEELLIKTFIEIEFLGTTITENWRNIHLVREKVATINKILKKTLDSVDKFFIKQFFRNFSNISYEGWREDKQTYPSDVLFQSPILNCLQNYLDIDHNNEYLKSQNENWKVHSPSSHVSYIQNIASIRSSCIANNALKSVYNDLLEEYTMLCSSFLKATKDGVAFPKEEFLSFRI